MTVGQWLGVWAKEYLDSVKPRTSEQYRYQIRVHLKPALGAVKLAALTTPMIQAMYNNELRKKRRSIREVDPQSSRCASQSPFTGRKTGLHSFQSL